jgi:NADH dehydrogenase subunit L (EC 1.6.5.3)
MENIYLTIALAPLVGAIIAGFFGSMLGRTATHTITILGVLVFNRIWHWLSLITMF